MNKDITKPCSRYYNPGAWFCFLWALRQEVLMRK